MIPVAQIVNDNVAFPPARKQQGPGVLSGAVYSFKLDVMREHPELLNAVMQLWAEHNEFADADGAALIESLQSELDSLIEGSQRAKQVFDDLEQEELQYLRDHTKAVDEMAEANRQYTVNSYNEDNDELLTRRQLADRESCRLKLTERIHKCALAEVAATNAFNRFIDRKNRAAQAGAAWKREALQVKSQLDSLLKGKEDQLRTGFQPA